MPEHGSLPYVILDFGVSFGPVDISGVKHHLYVAEVSITDCH